MLSIRNHNQLHDNNCDILTIEPLPLLFSLYYKGELNCLYLPRWNRQEQLLPLLRSDTWPTCRSTATRTPPTSTSRSKSKSSGLPPYSLLFPTPLLSSPPLSTPPGMHQARQVQPSDTWPRQVTLDECYIGCCGVLSANFFFLLPFRCICMWLVESHIDGNTHISDVVLGRQLKEVQNSCHVC